MTDWTRTEVQAIVDDYLFMLASELAGAPYNKAAYRRALKPLLNDRSDQSIEFKHCNISAALLDAAPNTSMATSRERITKPCWWRFWQSAWLARHSYTKLR